MTAQDGNRQPGTSSETALERLAAILQLGEASARRGAHADPGAYEEVFHRLGQNVGGLGDRLIWERQRAPRLWQTLEKHPQGWRLLRIRNDRRFHTWGLYQCLIERARGLAGSDPSAATESAELALAVARCLDPAEYGEAQTADFQATAHAALSEVQRQDNDLPAAWESFAAAESCLQEGTGDPLEQAELELLRERLLRDSGREREADWAHRRAQSLFRRIGDPRLEPGHAPEGETRQRARLGRR